MDRVVVIREITTLLGLGLLVVMVLGSVLAPFGCDESRIVDPVSDRVLIEGEITDIGTDVGDLDELAILVENSESTTGYQRVIFYIRDGTFIETGNPAIRLSVEDLEVGIHVRVWPRGIVTTTNPAIAEAGRIEVFEP